MEVSRKSYISKNNVEPGWYWEIIENGEKVLARGIADTQVGAVADAMVAELVIDFRQS